MNWKYWTVLVIAAFLIEFTLLMLEINYVIAMAATFIVVMGGYLFWWLLFNKRLIRALDEECDPLKFIEKWEKAKSISKRAAYQNLCNLNIAVGIQCLGRNREAVDFLTQNVDLHVKNGKALTAVYHLALYACYINLDDLESAALEYDGYLKELRKSIKYPQFAFAVDASFAEYQYRQNKTPETAKVFLEQLEYLYNNHSGKLSKRSKLNVLYNKADILAELGDYESAKKKYEIVAENGNGLWIAEKSREKLEK